MMRSRFDITAASEIMSIMSLARDLPDLAQASVARGAGF